MSTPAQSAPADTSVARDSATLPSPAVIMRMAIAYRSSMVLFAASELDVFTGLAPDGATHAQLVNATRAQPEPLRLLLESLVAEGLITREGDRYRNTAAADAFLVRGRPTYSAHQLKYAEDLYEPWRHLAAMVRTGRPAIDPESILGDDKQKTRAFVLAMHERARGMSNVLPYGADFSGRKHLLDIGGGPGTYSMALVQRNPGLRATVLDLPGVLEVTRELVDSLGFADRIELRPGNYLTSDFGSGYDAALLSGMMHRETEANCRRLLERAFAALDPGGLVVVSDVFFDSDDKNSPPFAVSFAINMMLTSPEGSAHASTAMARWMSDAGFGGVEVKPLPPPNPHILVVGRKP